MDVDKRYTEAMLADGSELVYLKDRFQQKKTKEQLDWLRACIRDSKFHVPLLPISHKPDLCESDDGKRFLPVFSQRKQMPPENCAVLWYWRKSDDYFSDWRDCLVG